MRKMLKKFFSIVYRGEHAFLVWVAILMVIFYWQYNKAMDPPPGVVDETTQAGGPEVGHWRHHGGPHGPGGFPHHPPGGHPDRPFEGHPGHGPHHHWPLPPEFFRGINEPEHHHGWHEMRRLVDLMRDLDEQNRQNPSKLIELKLSLLALTLNLMKIGHRLRMLKGGIHHEGFRGRGPIADGPPPPPPDQGELPFWHRGMGMHPGGHPGMHHPHDGFHGRHPHEHH